MLHQVRLRRSSAVSSPKFTVIGRCCSPGLGLFGAWGSSWGSWATWETCWSTLQHSPASAVTYTVSRHRTLFHKPERSDSSHLDQQGPFSTLYTFPSSVSIWAPWYFESSKKKCLPIKCWIGFCWFAVESKWTCWPSSSGLSSFPFT